MWELFPEERKQENAEVHRQAWVELVGGAQERDRRESSLRVSKTVERKEGEIAAKHSFASSSLSKERLFST